MRIDAQITFCLVADLAASSHFYGELLGLDLALDQGTCRIFRTRPGAYLGFCEKVDAPRPEGVILTLVTDDVDGFAHMLRRRGVARIRGSAH